MFADCSQYLQNLQQIIVNAGKFSFSNVRGFKKQLQPILGFIGFF